MAARSLTHPEKSKGKTYELVGDAPSPSALADAWQAAGMGRPWRVPGMRQGLALIRPDLGNLLDALLSLNWRSGVSLPAALASWAACLARDALSGRRKDAPVPGPEASAYGGARRHTP
jgi:hypothetical protein